MRKAAMGILAGLMLFAAAACTDPAATSSTDNVDVSSTSDQSGSSTSDERAGYFTSFTAQSVSGEEYTQAVFTDRDLTLVNIMATWCSPCIAEIPELEKLYTDAGVGVVGIVLDTAVDGEVDSVALEDAKTIIDTLGVTYPLLIPDAAGFNGLDATIQAFPTSYFVNSSGEVVAGPYEGARDLEAWQRLIDTVEKEL